MSPESCPPGAFRCGSRQGVARQSGRGRWSRRRPGGPRGPDRDPGRSAADQRL